jgi:hypothetical protein
MLQMSQVFYRYPRVNLRTFCVSRILGAGLGPQNVPDSEMTFRRTHGKRNKRSMLIAPGDLPVSKIRSCHKRGRRTLLSYVERDRSSVPSPKSLADTLAGVRHGLA